MSTTATEVETVKAVFETAALKRVVSNVALFADVPASNRPLLTGVLLVCDGRTLTASATDNYTMGEDKLNTASEDAVQPFRIAVPAKALVAAFKAATGAWVELKVEGDTLTVNYFEGEQRIRAIEGVYPNTDHVWPDHSDEERDGITHIGFNPRYLARFDKVKTGLRFGNPAVRFSFGTTGQRAVLVSISGYDSFRGLIMPVRSA